MARTDPDRQQLLFAKVPQITVWVGLLAIAVGVTCLSVRDLRPADLDPGERPPAADR